MAPNAPIHLLFLTHTATQVLCWLPLPCPSLTHLPAPHLQAPLSRTHTTSPPHPTPPLVQAQLSPRWQQLVSRDPQGRLDPRGQVWAAPYRWGCLLIAYRSDKLAR